MGEDELEGDWIHGWPDRKRAELMPSRDAEGRVIMARSPVLDLEGLITPTDASYIVTQLEMPDPIHPDDYSFSLFGEIENAVEYSLEELRRLPGRTVRAVTECAGDDAAFFDYLQDRSNNPKPSLRVKQEEFGTWRRIDTEEQPEFDPSAAGMLATGLVSAGEWIGVPLSEVLQRAGVKDSAVAIRVEGFDEGRPDPMLQFLSVGRDDFEVVDPGIINYDKGLPMDKAMDPDTILAWSHNGEYLQHVHGAPVRLIVPGWAGNWWVKWIHKIEVMDHMPDCYHQTHYFVSGKSPDDPEKKMMTALGVKTLIKYPRDEDSPIKTGVHSIRGMAWSGEGEVVRIEVSTDGGESWAGAHVEYSPDKWLWIRWSYLWEVDAPGAYSILARATDEQGRVQPQTEWNFQRKHFDGIVPMDVVVEA